MEIIVGKTAGFCYGVKRAVDNAVKETEKNKKGNPSHTCNRTNVLWYLLYIDYVIYNKGKYDTANVGGCFDTT